MRRAEDCPPHPARLAGRNGKGRTVVIALLFGSAPERRGVASARQPYLWVNGSPIFDSTAGGLSQGTAGLFVGISLVGLRLMTKVVALLELVLVGSRTTHLSGKSACVMIQEDLSWNETM